MIFQVNIGTNVANKKDKNNSDCDIKLGKKLIGNKIPIKIDLEKSGLGNNNNPINNPVIIEM